MPVALAGLWASVAAETGGALHAVGADRWWFVERCTRRSVRTAVGLVLLLRDARAGSGPPVAVTRSGCYQTWFGPSR